MLDFHVQTIFTKLEGRCPLHLLEALDDGLSFYPPGFFFTKLYKLRKRFGDSIPLPEGGSRPLPDGKVHLFDQETLTFPSGLLPRAIEISSGVGLLPVVVDQRPLLSPPSPIPNLYGIEFWKHQKESVVVALREGTGCLNLATNAGKTEVMAAILKTLGKPGLVVVNRSALMSQTANRLQKRLGGPVGLLGSGHRPGRAAIVVATVQTLYRRLRDPIVQGVLSRAEVLLVDEAHNISPISFFPVLSSCPARYRFGLSGTIKEAAQRMAVEAYLGPIIKTVTNKELVEEGLSAHPTIGMVDCLSRAPIALEFGELYRRFIVENVERNNLLVEAASRFFAKGLRTLILVVRIEHGWKLKALLQGRGISCEWVYGDTPLPVIEQAIRRFEAGQLPVLIASTIFDQGMDIPSIGALICAGGWKAPSRILQRLGRALRRKPFGDNTVQVLDFYDLGNKLLERHSKSRQYVYSKQGFPVQTGRLNELVSPLRIPMT